MRVLFLGGRREALALETAFACATSESPLKSPSGRVTGVPNGEGDSVVDMNLGEAITTVSDSVSDIL